MAVLEAAAAAAQVSVVDDNSVANFRCRAACLRAPRGEPWYLAPARCIDSRRRRRAQSSGQ